MLAGARPVPVRCASASGRVSVADKAGADALDGPISSHASSRSLSCLKAWCSSSRARWAPRQLLAHAKACSPRIGLALDGGRRTGRRRSPRRDCPRRRTGTRLALADRFAAQRVVARGWANWMTGVVQRTLSSTVPSIRAEFAMQLLPLDRFLRAMRGHAARHRVARRLVAGDDEEEVVREQLDRRQRRIFDRAVRHHADDVLGPGAVRRDSESTRTTRCGRGRASPWRSTRAETRGPVRDDLVGPAEEQFSSARGTPSISRSPRW